MTDERTDITIPQELKEDYEHVKSMAKGSQYSINWSQALEMLNQHIEQNFPERSVLTEEYINCLMYAACFCNNYNLSAWLINNGANVNFQDHESGNTLLHLAALKGNTQLAKLLTVHGMSLERNIKTNLKSNTYLHLAAEGGYNEFIQFIKREVALKSMGMDNICHLVGYKNKEGNTALHLAVKNGHVGFVKELLSNSFYYFGKNNSLYNFIFFCVITVIYSCGISILLHHATIQMIESRDYNSLYYLYFYCGICITISLGFSIYFLRSYIIEDKYSSVIVNNDGKTASHLAIENLQEENDEDRHYQCARLLIEHIPHSKINTQDKEGRTILHLAAEKGFIKSIELLLNKKADAKIMTDNKKTALHLAIENSHYDCAMSIAQDILKAREKGLRLKLREPYNTMKNKYDYHIKPYMADLKEKIQKKTQLKESWEKEVLCLTIKHQSKGSSDYEKWLLKREVIGQLLTIVDESEIDEVYNYVKNYAERKDVKDNEYILKKFSNFFRKSEKYKDKNLTKLRKQESWNKDYALYCANTSLTIVAIFFLLEQSFDFSKNDTFVYIENKAMIIAKVISIFSFCLAIGLYFKHKELDKIEDYQDKIDEISDLLTKKAKGSSSNKPEELCFDAEEACTSQQQRKSSYTFSKSELPIFKPRKVYSDDQLELVPLLPPRLIETRRSLPSEQPNKLIQTYQSITEQSSTLDIELISEPECRKTLDRKLIKNPSFYELETRL